MVFKNLFRRKGRTILTLAGIATGVAAMVALGALGASLAAGYQAVAGGSQPDAFDLTMSAVEEHIGDELHAMPEVRQAAGMLMGNVSAQGGAFYFFLFGHEPDKFAIQHFRVVRGEGLTAQGVRGRPLLLGKRAAAALELDVGDAFRLTGPADAAQADPIRAQSELARLQAGARPEEIAIYEAQLTQAEWELWHLTNVHKQLLDNDIGGAPEEQARFRVEAARATLDAAQAQLDLAKAGATADEIAIARAGVNAAQAQVTIAQVGVDAAEAALAQAQDAVDEEIIEMMHRLNRELGTTFIVVTHDPAIARQTDRIIELDSGRIVRENIVGDSFDEDWKDLRASALGQPLLNGSQSDLVVNGVLLYRGGQLTEAGVFLREMLIQGGGTCV